LNNTCKDNTDPKMPVEKMIMLKSLENEFSDEMYKTIFKGLLAEHTSK